MKHGEFLKDVKEQLESQAAFVICITGHKTQRSGLPDLLVVHRDWKGWIEIKIKDDPCRPLQQIQAAKIELREMPIYVLRCKEMKDLASEPELRALDIRVLVYTLENFQGDVIIKAFDDLKELLSILKELELDKWNEG